MATAVHATDIVGWLQLVPVINATGTVTRLGASPIDADVIAAMAAASQLCVDMAELQARASRINLAMHGRRSRHRHAGRDGRIARGAAACIAGLDPIKMAKLPIATDAQ